jgi:hypothetical protein
MAGSVSSPAPPPPTPPTEEELAQKAATARLKEEQQARIASDRVAFAAGLRGRSAFLSTAGSAGFGLGGGS